MKTWETCLPPEAFVRAHRSALVAVQWIDELRIVEGRRVLCLRTGQELPLSRRQARLFRELWG